MFSYLFLFLLTTYLPINRLRPASITTKDRARDADASRAPGIFFSSLEPHTATVAMMVANSLNRDFFELV